MNYSGIIIGAASLVIIGVWHSIVVKGEYYFGKRICSIVFALLGFGCIAASLFVPQTEVSILLALFGFSALWGIKEVIEQEQRVKRGWFPKRK